MSGTLLDRTYAWVCSRPDHNDQTATLLHELCTYMMALETRVVQLESKLMDAEEASGTSNDDDQEDVDEDDDMEQKELHIQKSPSILGNIITGISSINPFGSPVPQPPPPQQPITQIHMQILPPLKAGQERCPECKEVYTSRTLKSHNGICGKCKAKCSGCKQRFKKRAKHYPGNKCNICYKKLTPRKGNEKVMCPGTCGMIRTQETLDKYGGKCHKCSVADGSVQTDGGKAQRTKVWDLAYGAHAREGPCYVCTNTIKIESFEMGHIVSERDGGKKELSNLRPVCRTCNASCSSENMDAYRTRCFGSLHTKKK